MLAPPSGVSQQPLQPLPEPTQGGGQPLPATVNNNPSEDGMYAYYDIIFQKLLCCHSQKICYCTNVPNSYVA